MTAKQVFRSAVLVSVFAVALCGLVEASPRVPVLSDGSDRAEAERLIRAIKRVPPERRISFVSAYFLGRPYPLSTKKRVKKQRGRSQSLEATNRRPIPLKFLRTSLRYLDCMTYVEHVLALSCSEPDYEGSFLLRLVDIMFNASDAPLMNHTRNHFASVWALNNERKGYVRNVSARFPDLASRIVFLNKVGGNRTRYIADRFMIYDRPCVIKYVPSSVLLKNRKLLRCGDILFLIKEIEGLDVSHMGFFIRKGEKELFRHASYSAGKVVDQDFENYMKAASSVLGVMVIRPVLRPGAPFSYSFVYCNRD